MYVYSRTCYFRYKRKKDIGNVLESKTYLIVEINAEHAGVCWPRLVWT